MSVIIFYFSEIEALYSPAKCSDAGFFFAKKHLTLHREIDFDHNSADSYDVFPHLASTAHMHQR
jgi:hypothetical protein